MSARYQTTGPALFFVQPPGDSGPSYFGTVEARPTVSSQPVYTPVQNDLGGTAPADQQFQGEMGVVVGTFNRFDTAVYKKIKQAPRSRDLTGFPPGQTGPYEQGAIMVQDGWAYPVWMTFPYYASPSNVLAGMPRGYYFPTAFLYTPKDEELGSQVERLTLTFMCHRKWMAANNFDQVALWSWYSNADSWFTNLPPIS